MLELTLYTRRHYMYMYTMYYLHYIFEDQPDYLECVHYSKRVINLPVL